MMDTIANFFNNIFDALHQRDNNVVVLGVYMLCVITAILLRVVTHVHYRAALAAFLRDAKDLKSREDVRKFRNGLLRRTVAAYKKVADKAVTRIPAAQLVERNVAAMNLLGWRYTSVSAFVTGMESGLLLVGLVLAVVVSSYAMVYGVLAVGSFILFRIFAAFFDFQAARAQLCDELLIYIEREIGRFYASDAGGAVLRLKNDLTDAVGRQTESQSQHMTQLTEAIKEGNLTLGRALAESTNQVGRQIADAMDAKLVDMNARLAETITQWEVALAQAGSIQSAMNDSAERLSHASQRIQSAAELLAKHMQGHSTAMSDQLGTLVGAIEAVQEGIGQFAAQQEALTRQAGYIERNQHVLDTTLASYEAALQNLTQSLGEGLGAFINLHAQNSAQAVNDALKGNLERILRLAASADQAGGDA